MGPGPVIGPSTLGISGTTAPAPVAKMVSNAPTPQVKSARNPDCMPFPLNRLAHCLYIAVSTTRTVEECTIPCSSLVRFNHPRINNGYSSKSSTDQNQE